MATTETSAGGVVVREHDGVLEMAVICPQGRRLWALPKGHLNPGETAEQAALREVKEETGLDTRTEAPLGDIRYAYQWKGKRVFKQVTFFLLRYVGGEINALAPEMRVEVDEARWIPLADAQRQLAYKGEQDMAAKAMAHLSQAS